MPGDTRTGAGAAAAVNALTARGSRRGSWATILANGPSLNIGRGKDLRRLNQTRGPIIGMNRTWQLTHVRQDYYVAGDRAWMDAEGVRDHPGLVRLEWFPGDWTPTGKRDPGVALRQLDGVRFSFDLLEGVQVGCTTLVAMQWAAWLGCAGAGILGLDLQALRGRGHFDGSPVASGIVAQRRLFEAAAPLLQERGFEVRLIGSRQSLCTTWHHQTFAWHLGVALAEDVREAVAPGPHFRC